MSPVPSNGPDGPAPAAVVARPAGAEESARANRWWWDASAADYQDEHGAFLGDADLLWCPEGLREADAHLLGDVRGRDVLEVGCGAAQGARWLVRAALGAGALFVAIQLVPYGWRHPNPPVVQDAPWPDAASAALARGSCYDCHSHETEWPVYSYVAPMSWLVRRDVEEGRHELNFSEWDRDAGEADDAADAVRDGSMPPTQYTLIHRGASLSPSVRTVCISAMVLKPLP